MGLWSMPLDATLFRFINGDLANPVLGQLEGPGTHRIATQVAPLLLEAPVHNAGGVLVEVFRQALKIRPKGRDQVL